MKPPTIEELKSIAETYYAMAGEPKDEDYRESILISQALTLWAESKERKQAVLDRIKARKPNPILRKTK